MMSFDLPQIPVQEIGIVVLAQTATKKRLKNEPGPFDPARALKLLAGWIVTTPISRRMR